ncbi:serine protease snake [Solenopsis invicta]|uniref:serine protease snake n=1 Tax=Solenopsis invicta TaxID=13686 RepID=UPI00193DEEAF|nr:serine protease snake [Solenopsis invicta]
MDLRLDLAKFCVVIFLTLDVASVLSTGHTSTPTPVSIQDRYSTFDSDEQSVSERKCQEFIEELAGVIWVSSLDGSKPSATKVVKNCEGTVNQLVIGGEETRPGEFPHMVALGQLFPQFELFCGGTLISHTWVLTAAHCTHGNSGGPTHARIGFHKLTDTAGITVAIKRSIRHPDYEPPAMYADIALILLMNPVTFSKFIRPACLYQQYSILPRQAWVSGWGVTEYSGELSDSLQKGQVNLVDNLQCRQKYGTSRAVPYGVTLTMVCASGIKNDTCEVYFEGPLQIIHSNSKCVFQIIGVTSFDEGCAMGIPGVYTRVSHYIQWIEENVWPEQ